MSAEKTQSAKEEQTRSDILVYEMAKQKLELVPGCYQEAEKTFPWKEIAGFVRSGIFNIR
jgi:hypothetical protein